MGREFTAADNRTSPKVAVISETLAKFLFEGANAVGRHLLIGSNDADVEVVGVVKDSKFGNIRETPPRFLYVPFEQSGDDFTRRAAYFVRTEGNERAVIPAARSIVQRADANIPVERLTSMRVMIDDSMYRDRLIAGLALAFGALATILAAVGLYGTMAYSTARRTREFGIRLALGADPRMLLWLAMREAGSLVGVGVALGVPLGYALARLAASQFYGVTASDPATLLGAVLLTIVVGVFAALGPSVRAARIDPIAALHYE